MKFKMQLYVDGKWVEIDDLIEKAEKYDGIQECVPLIHHLTFEQVVKEYKTMKDKLEVIKNHLDAVPHDDYCYDIGHISFQEFMVNFYSILKELT